MFVCVRERERERETERCNILSSITENITKNRALTAKLSLEENELAFGWARVRSSLVHLVQITLSSAYVCYHSSRLVPNKRKELEFLLNLNPTKKLTNSLILI